MKFAWPLLLLSVGLAGCARVAANSEIAPDGSFERSILYVTAESTDSESGGISGSAPPEQVFRLPSGAPWKIERTKRDGNVEIRARRTFPAGQAAAGDMVVLDDKGAELIANEAKVEPLGEGRFLYTETIRWKGTGAKEVERGASELKSAIVKHLPEGARDDASVARTTEQLLKVVWRALFGPSEPLLGTLLVHPDLGERKLFRILSVEADKVLLQVYGDRLTQDQRRAVIRNILGDLREDTLLRPSNATREPAPPTQNAKGGLVSMLVSVKLPGTIVETNGEADPVNNEVYWAMYPEAAQLGDVVLRVVYEVREAGG